jgi:hypothetical protein
MYRYKVPIKSLDLARDLYYKENPNLGRGTLTPDFHQHLKNEYGIRYVLNSDEVDDYYDMYNITFATEQAATFFILKFSHV